MSPALYPCRIFRSESRAAVFARCVGVLAILCLAPVARADNWALLIGIDQYEDANRINPLGAAGADARAIGRTLQEMAGFANDHVRLLVSDGEMKPTRTKILDGLAWLKKNAAPGDTVFVLYSGHGIEVAGVPYLLPFDTSASDDDTLIESAIPAATFRAKLAQVKAKALILAFDMCRSDPRKAGKAVAASDNKLSRNLARGLDFKHGAQTGAGDAPSAAAPVAVTLYSCSPGERSYEWADKGRGYFSYYLEQGLRGKAADASGKVTALGLARYIGRETQAAVKREEQKAQTPYPSLDGPGADGFVLARGAKGGTSSEIESSTGSVMNTQARLSVSVNAPDPTITVDGKAVTGGAFTANLLDDPEKKVTVKVTASGYEGQLVTATLRRGKTITLPVTLVASAPANVATKVLLAYRVRKGQTRRSIINLTLKAVREEHVLKSTSGLVSEARVESVAANGDFSVVDKSRTESMETTMDGAKLPSDRVPDATARVTCRASGEVIAYSDNGLIPETGDAHAGARTQIATTIIFPATPVGVGDIWTHEYTANARFGTPNAVATFELVGFGNSDGVPCVRIRFSYKETDAYPMSVQGVAYLNRATGEMLRGDISVTGFPILPDGALSGEATMTYRPAADKGVQ